MQLCSLLFPILAGLRWPLRFTSDLHETKETAVIHLQVQRCGAGLQELAA